MEQIQEEQETTRQVHFNKPQLRSMAVMAQTEFAIWGRGTGKSDGLIAPRAAHNVFAMERSLGAFVARSYQQLLTRTLPPVIRGWERLGYRMGKDFYVLEEGPSSWDKPLMPPLIWSRAIHWRNGSAIAMISQERPGSANGLSIDWDILDEIKFLKKDQYDEEVVPAKRGNNDIFGKMSCHGSMLACTDMPTSPASRWILDMEKEMDPRVIELILATQLRIAELRTSIASGTLGAESIRVYASKVRRLESELNELRKGTVYFSTASALDNIEVLGEPYLARMKLVLPDYLFRTSILNLRPDRVEGGFYPDLDDEQHTYVPPDADYILGAGLDLDKLEVNDCRKDGMIIPSLPLEIAPDFGSSFNCLVVAQLFDMEFNIDNQIYVKHPQKIKHLATAFDRYYRPHKCKKVRLYYDHTMVGEDAMREWGFILELQRELQGAGWEVELVYIGQAPGHHEKYVFWGRRFANADPSLPRVRWNAENCEPTLLSMRLAGAKQTRKGFEKDKAPEKDPNSDQSETTHLSDACDLLVIGRCLTLGSGTTDSVDTVFA